MAKKKVGPRSVKSQPAKVGVTVNRKSSPKKKVVRNLVKKASPKQEEAMKKKKTTRNPGRFFK